MKTVRRIVIILAILSLSGCSFSNKEADIVVDGVNETMMKRKMESSPMG